MDITEATEARFNLGIERFVSGALLEFEGVRFSLARRGVLSVDTFSSWEPDRATPEQALAAIRHGKQVLDELLQRSAIYRAAVQGLPQEHTFCYDDGKGSIAIAKEEGERIIWLWQG